MPFSKATALLLCLSLFTSAHPNSKNTESVQKTSWAGEKSSFHGYDQYDFQLDGLSCKIVAPEKSADGKPWIWRARFFGHAPHFDLAMLKRGYHIAYCDVSNLFGNAEAVKRWNKFYEYLRFEHLFSDRPVLEGMSRGGLIIYNWAAANPTKVAAIYADAPVMDFKSWPGGKGTGAGSPKAWQSCLQAYALTEEQALTYPANPLNRLAPLAKADIPIIHVVGDKDQVVPVAENTAIAHAFYTKMGGTFQVIHKPNVGHHPHSLKDPQKIVNFITKHGEAKALIPAEEVVSDQNFILRGNYHNSRLQFEQKKRGHVAFIGGSITKMAGYRPMVSTTLQERFPETKFTFTQAGISSTCSDTGAFRLQRDVLSQGPLDLLFIEFAVNDDQDGHFSEEHALLGMEGIVAQARKHNPNVDIVITFFANNHILSSLQDGKSTASLRAHSKVAAHYDISVNHLAQELAELITAEKVDWKTYGGVHPKAYGNRMCATMIGQALLKEWDKPLPSDAQPQAHPLKKLLNNKSYTRGRFLPHQDAQLDAHWKVGVPDWQSENQGKVRDRFLQSPLIYSSTPGAKIRLTFHGTAIGAYLLSGTDAGIIRCTIDGKETREINTRLRYNFNYPTTVIFFDDLRNGKHTLELEILPAKPSQSGQPDQPHKKTARSPAGTSLRILNFVAN